MKKLLSLLAVSATVCTVTAAPADYNGGFEKVNADSKGTILPVGWISNRRVTKNATVRASKESECFRSGTFGLLCEVEEKGCLSFRALKMIPVKAGDTIKVSIYSKGAGKFAIQYIAYGLDDKNISRFISTLGFPRVQSAQEENWGLYSRSAKFVVPKKAVGKYDKFVILPVIYVYGNSEICFDDFSMEVVPAK